MSFVVFYPVSVVWADGPAHHRLHVKFTLARCHNLKDTTAYAHMENIAGDPNLTVEVIQRELKRVEKELGKLPPALAIQLDNCFRENKNSYVINYCGWLVERGAESAFVLVDFASMCLQIMLNTSTRKIVYSSPGVCAAGLFPGGIFISFLPKGHTHNEMDQCASRISVAVRRKDIHTREQLYEAIEESCENLRVEQVDRVADTKSFLNPGVNSSGHWTAASPWKRVNNVSAHRFFRIAKSAVGVLELRTKQHCLQDFWSEVHKHIEFETHQIHPPHTYTRTQATTLLKNPDRPSGQDWSTHPGSTVKVLPESRLDLIRRHLDMCKP